MIHYDVTIEYNDIMIKYNFSEVTNNIYIIASKKYFFFSISLERDEQFSRRSLHDQSKYQVSIVPEFVSAFSLVRRWVASRGRNRIHKKSSHRSG